MEFYNFALYLLLFLLVLRINKRNYLLLFIVCIWLISSFIGIFYVKLDVFKIGNHRIEFLPFLYLFSVFLISIVPLFFQKKEIHSLSYKNENALHLFSYFLGILSLWPFVETVYRLLGSLYTGQFFLLGSLYEDIADGYIQSPIDFSLICSKLTRWCGFFRIISPVLLLYYLYKYPHKRVTIIGLFMCSIIIPLNNLTIGSKTQIVFYGLYIIGLYFFIHAIYEKKTKRKIVKLLTYCCIFIMVNILISSISRYIITQRVNNVSEVGDFLFKYSAESMYNFNQNAYYEKNYLGGYSTMMPVLEVMGLSKVKYKEGRANEERRNYISRRISSDSWVFYSAYGDLYLDFGPILTIFIVLITSLLLSTIVINRHMKLYSLFIYSIYIYVICNSLFYFCFKLSFAPIYTSILVGLMAFCIETPSTPKRV